MLLSIKEQREQKRNHETDINLQRPVPGDILLQPDLPQLLKIEPLAGEGACDIHFWS